MHEPSSAVPIVQVMTIDRTFAGKPPIMWALISLWLLVLLSACAPVSRAGSPAAAAIGMAPRIIVLSEAQVRESWNTLSRCGREEVENLTPAWTPSAEQISTTDSIVRLAIETALGRLHVSDQSHRYVVQYFGVYHNGRPLVFANGLHPRMTDAVDGVYNPMVDLIRTHMYTSPSALCDGGVNRFTMVVDTDGGEFRRLRFNATSQGRLPPH